MRNAGRGPARCQRFGPDPDRDVGDGDVGDGDVGDGDVGDGDGEHADPDTVAHAIAPATA